MFLLYYEEWFIMVVMVLLALDFFIITVGLFAVAAFCLGALICYGLLSVSLTCLAKNNGYGKYALLAWIPLLKFLLVGMLCGDVEFLNLTKVRGVILSVLMIVSFFAINLNTFGMIMALVFMMSFLHVSYGLLRKIHKPSAPYMTFLAAIFPIIPIAFIFVKRNVIFEETYIVE
ncbi:hypothetical protein HMPREF0379_0089 [[Eubacterium] yurii subsp. margaretiae ATCC 43715]|nr:hypothetical protein HMPREF0379_0089 [[Eubacterium] yurii subsp. margaretiae ATCC 43715]